MTLPYIWLLAGVALVALVIAWSAWQQRTLPSAMALMWLSLAVAEWTATYALELSASSYESKLAWAKLEYIGIVSTPVAWLVMAARVAGVVRARASVRNERFVGVPFLKNSHVAAFMVP